MKYFFYPDLDAALDAGVADLFDPEDALPAAGRTRWRTPAEVVVVVEEEEAWRDLLLVVLCWLWPRPPPTPFAS